MTSQAPEHAIRRAIAWLLGFTVLFIVYASLYPFEFDATRLARFTREDWLKVVAWRRPIRSDLIANLIFYLPFGALLTALAPRRWGPLRRFLLTLACGTALSLLIELAQGFTVKRDPSLIDVMMNSASTALACLLALGARGLGLKPALPELRTSRPDFVAVLIVGLWLCMHSAPFMPAQRFISYFSNPARALDWDWSTGAFAGFLAGYLLVGTVLRSLLRPSSFWKLFLACALLSILARIVFRDQRLALSECVGLLCALPLIWRVHASREQTAYRLALLWAAPAFVFYALAPFDFSGAPEFEWMTLPPLTERLNAGEPGLLEICFFYAGAVWLLREARLPLARIVFGMMTTALLIEVAQAWEPTRNAQLVAPAAVLIATVLIWIRDRFSVATRRVAVPE
ncbi:MAG: VanZ family protein [Gammaproteobacteria bacterium]